MEQTLRRGFHCDNCGGPAHESGEYAAYFDRSTIVCYDCSINPAVEIYLVVAFGLDGWQEHDAFLLPEMALACIQEFKTRQQAVKVECWIMGKSENVIHSEIKTFANGWQKQ